MKFTRSPWAAYGMLVAPRDNTPAVENDPAPKNPPEIDLSQYMPKAAFQTELNRRVAAIAGKAKSEDDFLQDEDFRVKAIEAWGIKPQGEQANQALTGEQLAQAQKDWEKKHLSPVAERATRAETRVQQLLHRDLHAQILATAGELGIKKSLLKTPVEGATPPIVNLLANYFGLDEEAGSWFTKEGDGFAFSGTPSAQSPYKSVSEFIREWTENEGKDFLEDVRQRGPGMGQPGGPKGSKDINVRISEAEAAGNFTLSNQLKAEKLRTL